MAHQGVAMESLLFSLDGPFRHGRGGVGAGKGPQVTQVTGLRASLSSTRCVSLWRGAEDLVWGLPDKASQ